VDKDLMRYTPVVVACAVQENYSSFVCVEPQKDWSGECCTDQMIAHEANFRPPSRDVRFLYKQVMDVSQAYSEEILLRATTE
jgi:hypothetical protein